MALASVHFVRFQLPLMTTSCRGGKQAREHHNDSGDPSTRTRSTSIRDSHASNRQRSLLLFFFLFLPMESCSCGCTQPSLQLQRSTFHRNRSMGDIFASFHAQMLVVCCSPAFCLHSLLPSLAPLLFFPPSHDGRTKADIRVSTLHTLQS